MKTKKGQETLKSLKKWLDGDQSKKVKLANLLGYNSYDTLNHWLRKKYIPNREIARVNAIIRRK